MGRATLMSRQNPGGNFIINDYEKVAGNEWFVDSGHAAAVDALGAGMDPDHPLATFAYLCTNFASMSRAGTADDVCYVAPRHAETNATASGITQPAGLKLVGQGRGARRPTFTFSAVGSTWLLSGANAAIENIIVTATAAVTKLFSVTAAGVTIDRVDYTEGSGLPLQFLLTSALADQLTIKNCRHVAVTAGASAQVWIEIVGTDDALIIDNVFHLALNNAAGSYTIRASTAAVRAIIQRNTIVQTGGTTQVSALSLVAASTGYVSDNRVAANVTTLAGTVALASAYGANNLTSHTVNKAGINDPVVDS